MVKQNPSKVATMKRRMSRLIFISMFAGISTFVVWLSSQSSFGIIHRMLSSSYQTCDISIISLPNQPIIPVFAASYPGSGAQMAHYLIEAITGLEAGDEWIHRGDTYDHITIKTHYPARQHQIEGKRLMQRVILLLRNPIHSIPSYHNYIYENNHQIPDHTVRAPPDAWVEWRDDNFDAEIRSWRDHLLYWMTEYEKKERLVISYEHLVDVKMGPIESTRIANFLGRTEGVEVVPPSHIPCVWDKVVNYKRIEVDKHGNELENSSDEEERKLSSTSRHLYDENGQRLIGQNNLIIPQKIIRRRVKYVSHEDPAHPQRSRREGQEIHQFTKQQLDQIRSMLNILRGKYLDDYTLVVILSEYIEEVDTEIKKVKGFN